MRWWAWALLWTVLLAGAVAVLLWQARSLWHKSMALLQELNLAADRLDVLDRELAILNEREAALDGPAVFAGPARLRRAGSPRHRVARHDVPWPERNSPERTSRCAPWSPGTLSS